MVGGVDDDCVWTIMVKFKASSDVLSLDIHTIYVKKGPYNDSIIKIGNIRTFAQDIQ